VRIERQRLSWAKSSGEGGAWQRVPWQKAWQRLGKLQGCDKVVIFVKDSILIDPFAFFLSFLGGEYPT